MYRSSGMPLISVAFVLTLMVCSVLGKERKLPSNCLEATRMAGNNATSGIYKICLPIPYWDVRPFFVYCLCETNCYNPWLVVQRRQEQGITFYRNWIDYKNGFGNIYTSFFIGLNRLHALTHTQYNELHIKMINFKDHVKYANYSSFAVGNEDEKFKLILLGTYTGDAGDALTGIHDGQKFSTYDQDNDDVASRNCAKDNYGGWWYKSCQISNLNGYYYLNNQKNPGNGINWVPWVPYSDSLKYVHMAIRPKSLY